ncbi:MAG: helix-turn-helix domain-containing protein, partial [Alphaproteobacteria bacterium]|nr:helix-turn-helix domain-containing protein [Alphaproteobacteria bacterium]
MPTQDNIISATIPQFCRLSGLGETKARELINSGVVRSFTIGKRRLVDVDSYRELIASQIGNTPATQP